MKYVQNSNPLTNMPGNKEIDSILKKHIKKKYDSTVVYVDLDNFKAYNDLYGFSRGDSLIKMTGDILRDVIIKVHNSKAFAGHIGGDDFVIFLPENNLEEYLDLIIEKFSSSIVSCYRKEDIDKGYCLSKDRAGKEKKYSLVTISLAAVKLSSVRGKSYMEIIDICTDLKRKAKSKEGNNYEIYLP
jgi:diguanylate cyclase (GGDEF)-like protein